MSDKGKQLLANLAKLIEEAEASDNNTRATPWSVDQAAGAQEGSYGDLNDVVPLATLLLPENVEHRVILRFRIRAAK